MDNEAGQVVQQAMLAVGSGSCADVEMTLDGYEEDGPVDRASLQAGRISIYFNWAICLGTLRIAYFAPLILSSRVCDGRI
jgi:hypothetical protein